jgi:hypothetical protein
MVTRKLGVEKPEHAPGFTFKLACAALISRGPALKPPMAFACYAGLKEVDPADIIACLRTVPPLQ